MKIHNLSELLILYHSVLLDCWINVGEIKFTSAYRHFVNTKEALEILSLSRSCFLDHHASAKLVHVVV